MNLKGGFIVLFKLFLRNIVIPMCSVMLVVWFVVTLFAGKGITHLEVLITGLVGLILSIILIRKL